MIHFHHLQYRDIKPANILIDKGQVKLADFGASKRLDEEVMAQGIQGVTGTLMYMAPEVLQSADGGGYGRRADVWSLGITLNELAYGKHPFDSLEDALIRACESQEPVPGFPPFFSKEAHEFLALCLVRDPKNRLVTLLTSPSLEAHKGESSRTHSIYLPTYLQQMVSSQIATS